MAFLSVVAFTFILLLSPQNFIPGLSRLRIAFLAAGAASAVLLWDRWQQRQPLLNLKRELAVAAALWAWALLTVPLSYWPGGSVNVLSDEYVKSLVIFWLLANVVTTPHRLRFVAVALILCSMPLATATVKNFLAGNFYDAGSQRAGGLQNGLGNPNDTALMLNLIMPLSIAVFLGTARPFVRVLCLLVIALNVLGVFLTLSRAGFLGLTTMAMVYFAKLVRRPSDRNWAFAMLFLGMLLLPVLPAKYVRRIATITNIEADTTGSAQERWSDNAAAIKFVARHPIVGAGIGMDTLALNDVRGARWFRVHNVYLEYAVDLGLPGLLLFMTLFYGVWSAARSSCRQTASVPAHRNLFLLVEGVEISLIVFAVSAVFYPVAYHFYFYYIAGLALATRSATDAAISMARAPVDGDAQTVVVQIGPYSRRLVANEFQ